MTIDLRERYLVETFSLYFKDSSKINPAKFINQVTLNTFEENERLYTEISVEVKYDKVCTSIKSAIEHIKISKSISKDFIEDFLNKYSLYYSTKVGLPKRLSSDFEVMLDDGTKPRIDIIESAAAVSASCKYSPRIIEDFEDDFLRLLSLNRSDIRSEYANLFRFAVNTDDPVTRFMLLYNILLLCCGDKQKKVDIFIVAEEQSVPKSTSPQTGKDETIYTRLRNEIAHRRNDFNPQKNRQEIIGRVSSLQSLVKSAIERLC